MNEEAQLKEKLRNAEYAIMNIQDFVNFLFDTELDYTTQSEQWEKFEKFQEQNEHN